MWVSCPWCDVHDILGMPHRLVGVILQSKPTIELANHGRNHHFWHPWETSLYFVLCTPSDCYLSSYFITETKQLKIACVKNHCETFEMSPTCRFSVLQKSKYKMMCIWRLTVILAQYVAIMTKWLCCSLIRIVNPFYLPACWPKVKSMRFSDSKFPEYKYKFIYPEGRALIWPHFNLDQSL